MPAPRSIDELEERLSRPSTEAVRTLAAVEGDILVLGAGGKMGPTLARMARRASEEAGTKRRIIAVSRFSDGGLPQQLERWGVETRACDLLDEEAVAALPDAPNVIFMTGMKFGATGNPSLTWAMNCYVPALACRRFRHSRMVVFSSGNVYGMTAADGTGSRETDPLEPVGEYSITVLGRERICDYFSRALGTPMAVLRLNYATELRYGVLVDLARNVWEGRPVDVSMPTVNVIWQADANAMSLVALAHVAAPPRIINLAGGEILRVREVAEEFGRLLQKPVQFVGAAGRSAYLNDGRAGHALLGQPQVPVRDMLAWTAEWVSRGGASLGKPTHFQVRSGKF